MFDWLFKPKDQFIKENESIAKEIHDKVMLLNKQNKYKARIVMDYILKSFSTDENVQDLYEKVYLNQDELKKIEEILSFESPIAKKWYKHYKGDSYKTIGVAIPVSEIKGYEDYFEVRHTEDNVNVIIYNCHQFLFHDYNDDVLMVYTNSNNTLSFARPYDMFFSLVEEDENIFPRFKKIEE